MLSCWSLILGIAGTNALGFNAQHAQHFKAAAAAVVLATSPGALPVLPVHATVPITTLIADVHATVPITTLIADAEADRETAELKAAIEKAKKLSDAQEKADLEAAKVAAKSAAKALAARGPPAKLPSKAADTDLSVALRGGAINLRELRVPQSLGLSLPVVGPLRIEFNAVVSKVTPEMAADADVVVGLPTDLVKAGKKAAGGDVGLAVDLPGFASGRLDVDVSTPRDGEADVVVTSPLFKRLPIQKTKGLGRFCFDCGTGAPESEWFVARNLGNGVQFYGNAKTGVSQFEAPKGF
jgi:hypothetical protein